MTVDPILEISNTKVTRNLLLTSEMYSKKKKSNNVYKRKFVTHTVYQELLRTTHNLIASTSTPHSQNQSNLKQYVCIQYTFQN